MWTSSDCLLILIIMATMASPFAACLSAGEPGKDGRIEWALALHGGAGATLVDASDERKAKIEQSMHKALDVGRTILAKGGTSLDAVEQVVRALEDDPLFNAGRGAVLNAEGKHELDASIMDGRNRACGAVTSVRTVKHPISLARRVMTDTPHVLLGGTGAEQFARQIGAEEVDNTYFRTQWRYESWLKARAEHQKQEKESGSPQSSTSERSIKGQATTFDHSADSSRGRQERTGKRDSGESRSSYYGTVGCVALDRQGNLAAATSTGGLTNKMPGRIGDSPIVAASTYADNATCAVSCTGVGEDFMRNAVAYDVSARMAYLDQPMKTALCEVIHRDTNHVTGGIIGVAGDGSIGFEFNTAGMSFAAADSTGRAEVVLAIQEDESSRPQSARE